LLDAGFLTAMKFRNLTMRRIFSVVFVLYYLVNSEQVTERIYKSWRDATISSIRVSWEKGIHPLNRLMYGFRGPRPQITQQLRIRRQPNQPDITVWIFYYGSLDELGKENSIVIHFPGGGFISIPTPCHANYLAKLAFLLKVPIISIDYRKAPEFPYPNGLNDCFDAYMAILNSKGKIVGVNHAEKNLRIACMGDSSGGNLAAGVIFRCIQAALPTPLGTVLCYPTLNMAPKFWLDREYYDEGMNTPQLSSLAKYVNDDVLVPNLLVKMISAYLTEGCDPINDIYLSPLFADDKILEQFPKTYIHCGGLDPLSDDSRCFAKRLQKSNPNRPVELYWFERLSHGYLLLLGLLPEADESIRLTARWLAEILELPSSRVL
jgi:acetyl esterase/lipase